MFQLGGIKSVRALPGDPTFNQSNNYYDATLYKKICAEFGIDPSSDYRFTHCKNSSLGNVYVHAAGLGTVKMDNCPGQFKFSDEGGKALDGT